MQCFHDEFVWLGVGGENCYRLLCKWQWYFWTQLAKPQSMDFSKVTRVNYAFFQTDVIVICMVLTLCSWANPNFLFGPYHYIFAPDAPLYFSHDAPQVENSAAHYYDWGLIGRAHAANAEVWPLIGSWTFSGPSRAMSVYPTVRSNFAQQCVKLITASDFDGINTDWEYADFEEHGVLESIRTFYYNPSSSSSLWLSGQFELASLFRVCSITICDFNQIVIYDVSVITSVWSVSNLMMYDLLGGWGDMTGRLIRVDR